MTQKELAALLGVTPGLISRYKHRGMPVDSGVRAAATWMANHVNARVQTPLDSLRARDREARKRAG